ncbi:GntR family transcriptional regulator [Paenibacillus sp. FJAT-26967]|uniref:GntR family transcriptional regulator n=1 Tax=Paenibacillus sp. FJAT-26967 TaxID=1729690 RepID=UPI000A00406A|nr:GntR family transcriptional regulator [Paenibacillus sp. FJAT-26967]
MHIPIKISPDSPEPMYHQIQVQLKALILSGHLPEGTLLPSIREFAKDLSCSVITIRRVYQDLETEGILRTRQGTGTFVAKVGTVTREQYRKEAVVEAMKEALRSGLRVGCSVEELRVLFEEALVELRDEEAAGVSAGITGPLEGRVWSKQIRAIEGLGEEIHSE